MGLMPQAIKQAVDMDDINELKKLNVNSCISCGSCSYICPAKIPLMDYCKLGKYELAKK